MRQEGQDFEISRFLSFHTPNPEGTFNLTEIELKIYDPLISGKTQNENIVAFPDSNPSLNLPKIEKMQEFPQGLPFEEMLKAFIAENDN